MLFAGFATDDALAFVSKGALRDRAGRSNREKTVDIAVDAVLGGDVVFERAARLSV